VYRSSKPVVEAEQLDEQEVEEVEEKQAHLRIRAEPWVVQVEAAARPEELSTVVMGCRGERHTWWVKCSSAGNLLDCVSKVAMSCKRYTARLAASCL
jgi:hypothetical protein